MKNIKIALIALLASLTFMSSSKAAVIDMKISQSGYSQQKDFKNVMDVIDAFNDGELDKYYSGFNQDLASNGYLNFRGIQVNMAFDGARSIGSGKLTVDIPSIGYHKEYTATDSNLTLKSAFKQFKEDLKKNHDDLLKKLLKEGVSHTPYDAIAGNPSSLLSQMVTMSTNNGILSTTSYDDGYVVMLSPSASHHEVRMAGKKTTIDQYTLPLGYAFKFGNGWALGFDMPLSYTDTDGSKTYTGQIGLTVQAPIYKADPIKTDGEFVSKPGFEAWYLIPAFRIGATGSEDLLSGGALYMGSLTSKMVFNITDRFGFDIVNMGSKSKSYKLDIQGYEIDYDIDSNIFKNGINIRTNLSKNFNLDVYFYDTRFKGKTKMYIDHYDEVGFKITKPFNYNTKLLGFITGWDFEATYIKGPHYDAYKAGFGLLF
ncbi:MAG: hypothetical protein MJ250_07720 [Alphaproteobacteria bacterium]|nr:hypothetical protein [Alphaproteobacteria bacterium]